MSRHVDANVNRFEASARAIRVARIAMAVPVGRNRSERALIADTVEVATPEQRAHFAKWYAGLKRPPSDETWRLVVAAVRARMTPANDYDPAQHITRG